MQYKLRVLSFAGKKGGEKKDRNYSITIPKDIVLMIGSETRFFVERSGTSIILTSGADIVPTQKEVEEYEFKDCITQ